MATINIGNLAFTHKGDYDGSTAYVKNDVVYYSSTGSAYIAKQSTTGNLPTSTAHWNIFSAGSGGIWNAGLSLGSAGQAVKVNSGGTALEFGTISSEIVKLAEVTTSSNATIIDFNGYFDDTTYHTYTMKASIVGLSANQQCRGRFLTAANTEYTGNHAWGHDYAYRHNNNSTNGVSGMNFGSNLSDHTRFNDWAQNTGRAFNLEWEFNKPQSTNSYKCSRMYCSNTNDGDSYYVSGAWISSEARTNTAFTGIRMYLNGGYYLDGSVFKLYGWKI